MWSIAAHRLRDMSQVSQSLLKICKTCGRQMTWRKKWKKNWSTIIYCSEYCRKHKVQPNSLDSKFESAILSLLQLQKSDRSAGRSDASTMALTCEDVEAHVLAERQKTLLALLKGAGDGATGPAQGAHEVGGRGGGDEVSPRGDEAVVTDGEDPPSEGAARRNPKRARERCRQAARRLAARGQVLISQGGIRVDPSFAKGVMELSLPEEGTWEGGRPEKDLPVRTSVVQ